MCIRDRAYTDQGILRVSDSGGSLVFQRRLEPLYALSLIHI